MAKQRSALFWIVIAVGTLALIGLISGIVEKQTPPRASAPAVPAAVAPTLTPKEKADLDARQLIANRLQRDVRAKGLDVTFALQGPKGEILSMSGTDVTLHLVGQLFPFRDEKLHEQMASLGFLEIDLPWGGKIDLGPFRPRPGASSRN